MQAAPELAGLMTASIQDAPRRVEYVAWASPGPSPATAQLLAILGIDPDG